MLSAAALLLTSLLLPTPQGQQGGFEGLTSSLEQRTAQRRAAAQTAWDQHGAAYLKQPSRGTMDPLLKFAPEIQEPVLKAIRLNLAAEVPAADVLPNLLQLLARCLNTGGSAELLQILPSLPGSERGAALRLVIQQGSGRVLSSSRTYLDHQDPHLRQAALEALLLRLPPEETPALLSRIRYGELEPESFGAFLDALADRDLPDAFQLPATSFLQTHPSFLEGLVHFLTAHPQENAEDFLLDRALDRAKAGLSSSVRTAALHGFEATALEFRLRGGPRQLTRALKDMARSPFSLEVAWTLHRLGEKAGKDYLLEGPEKAAKRNPDDWRAQFALGQMQVDVGEFHPAYRVYKKTLETIEDTPVARRIEKMDYLYAARAAAGAKKSKDSGLWLAATRMRPEELAKYRDLPEFEPYLKKDPFRRLFQVAD
ncbi:MAG: hypothetical protein ACYTEP_09300 [Planctomycetota bacterium]|jgi:hypothetical protein